MPELWRTHRGRRPLLHRVWRAATAATCGAAPRWRHGADATARPSAYAGARRHRPARRHPTDRPALWRAVPGGFRPTLSERLASHAWRAAAPAIVGGAAAAWRAAGRARLGQRPGLDRAARDAAVGRAGRPAGGGPRV